MNVIRLIGAAALASTALVSVTAYAQTAAPAAKESKKDVAKADEDDGSAIIVTGSRIPRPEYEGTLPGVQVTAEQIEARGFTNALEAVNDIPLVGRGASPFNGNNGGQAASLGSAFINLLDIGTQRTLTLVNGRRYVSGNAASLFVESNAAGSQVDVNSIPSSLIKRVDVVTVGGAAAYGSDAIAGVVNFILDDSYEGIEGRALGGMTDKSDAKQYQLGLTAGKNFKDGRINVTFNAEYTRIDGLQADQRDFRLLRATTITNFANGSKRNPNFGSAIIDVTGANNGAFLRASDDGIPSSALILGSVNQTLSFNGTVLNALSTPRTPYVTFAGPSAPNYITLTNGVGQTSTSFASTAATAAQIINGLPGAPGSLISGNGLNGAATVPTGLTFTTFAPTSLPTGVTSTQVLTAFNVTPPAGATAAQLTTLAVNVLQANRPTAREFYAANPSVPFNYFLGTFIPNVPRIANTDTTLVTVAGVRVPVNQVLPFVAVPLEFNADGTLRAYNAGTIGQNGQGTISQLAGGNGGFLRSIENTVLRTQQDRFVANLNAKWELNDTFTLFTENLYARVRNVSVRNSTSQNFLSTGAENAALVLNVNNPYLTQQNLDQLNAVGINALNRGGYFSLTRQNQDIFGDNPFINTSDTYRIVGGARAKWEMFGHAWNAEVSATYGYAKQLTQTTNIKDIEYQLALDAVRDPVTNNIRCRAQLFPGDYLNRTPAGTASNLIRLMGPNGVRVEQVFTPTITQSMIDGCQPLNPFGYNNMSAAAKAYVRADVEFYNISRQTFLQGTITGSFFDLPAGELAVSGTAEYRKEELDFSSNLINQLGRTRTAPSAATVGGIEVFEYGGEARIPIFGDNFLPFFGKLDLSPSIRVSQQNGSAASYQSLSGGLVSPSSNGRPQTIWSLAGTWAPVRDILLRANLTRSIRQPGVVELFLGGQPAFTTPTDVCGPNNIDVGAQAVNRRANCRRAVIAAGLATDTVGADQFLQTFQPAGVSLPGSFAGAPGLNPEQGRSWTAGIVVKPRWISNLQFSVDYISLDLKNIILPTNLSDAVRFCYDSATYNDTSAATGANTCTFFARQRTDFQIAPGFASGFINLSATKIRALNISANYNFNLPGKLGNLALSANAYNLIRYDESATGAFNDTIGSAGTFGRPQWEVQSRARYTTGDFYAQVVWNWQSQTKLFSNGLPATIEQWNDIRFPAVSRFDVTLGADLTKKIRVQGNIVNLTNKYYAGTNGLYQGAYVDQIGRRFLLSATVKY
ncbi:MAG: TonB-dependent receptor [Sphingomonadales bacterium]